MILVTGAGGKTGRAVIRALAARGRAVRALVRDPARAAAVRAEGAAQVALGDMLAEAALAEAAQGVRAVYHICPNVHPDEVAIAQAVLAAARAAGVEHFVYHSVLHPQTEAMPHHWRKLRVEEALFEAGLPFTILQPAPYMQNILAGWPSIVADGVFGVPYPAGTRLSLVDLADVAEAAARVMSEPFHASAAYELVGTAPLTQTEVAAVLAEGLGRPVEVRSESVSDWAARARASGMGGDQVETLAQMFRYYERHGLAGNPNVLGWLLGRPPGSLRAFVERILLERSS